MANTKVADERMERRRKLLELRAEEVEKLNTDVRERLIFLIDTQMISTGRYEYLEKRYGISARKWKNVCNRVQLPGIDMLSSILKDHPYFAMWLMIGKGDNNMQIDPTVEGWELKYQKALFDRVAAPDLGK